jgi:hypothetical protein
MEEYKKRKIDASEYEYNEYKIDEYDWKIKILLNIF